MYNLAKQELAKKLTAGSGTITSLAVHGSGDHLLVGSEVSSRLHELTGHLQNPCLAAAAAAGMLQVRRCPYSSHIMGQMLVLLRPMAALR